MDLKIALAGNPNCGKTTMFNGLTGSAQYVGNWPGVTVEKKEGKLKGHKDVVIQDLPGIYSLSPYTLEEVVARGYLIKEKPDAIINIIDGTNIERNLYLTTQLLELSIPMVVAVNMMDLVKKNGDVINLKELSRTLGCEVLETSALKDLGSLAVAEKAIFTAQKKIVPEAPHYTTPRVQEAISEIAAIIKPTVGEFELGWYAIKVFERDSEVMEHLKFDNRTLASLEKHISACEKELDDDSESIIINQRYDYIRTAVDKSVVKKNKTNFSSSDKIDQIVTNRWLAIPIFMAVMFFVYYISVTTMGALVTDYTNDVFFGEMIIPTVSNFLSGLNVAPWLSGLIVDGIIGGVGGVLGFVPQMLILFLLLSILEDCGYMARVAFIMDRVFRKFGLSGKSFIPMLIGSGCSVPGIMASRTIEQERDRRMTIMTTSFVPCGAKIPIIGLIAGSLFGGAWWIAPTAYFIGIGAVIISGIILKKLPAFSGTAAPFVMELPSYHLPTPRNILNSTWERGFSFIKRAGTVILVASVLIWFLSSFAFVDGSLSMVEDMNSSVLAIIGGFAAPLFAPLGFGNWQAAVATVMGLVAKEEVVGVFGVIYGISGDALALVESGTFNELTGISSHFTALSGFSFLVFNLLCAPCFAAIGAIKREMNSPRWTWFAVGYLTIFAYTISLIVFQIGTLITTGSFTPLTAVALALIAGLIYLLVRKEKQTVKN